MNYIQFVDILLITHLCGMGTKTIQKNWVYNNITMKKINLTSNTSMSLMELLIAVSLITLLATGLLILINPKQIIDRAWDSKRKNDLSLVRKIVESTMDDKERYPLPTEICYTRTDQYSCYICGNQATSPKNTAYFDILPCDPLSSTNYVYQVDDLENPRWYRIYTRLSVLSDPDITGGNCPKSQCGFSSLLPTPPQFKYNLYLESGPPPFCPESSPVYCWKNGCNLCPSRDACKEEEYCETEKGIYKDSNCNQVCSLP